MTEPESSFGAPQPFADEPPMGTLIFNIPTEKVAEDGSPTAVGWMEL